MLSNVQTTQELKSLDHSKHIGYVIKQNCRICGEESPRIIHESPLHQQSLLCAL